MEPVDLRDGLAYRFTTQLPDRTHHENLQPPAARERLGVLLADYGQGLLQSEEADWQVLGEKILRRAPTRPVATRVHDRRKRYLLEEGTPVPFLVELGVMTPDGRVRKSRYDKFRQVNRFLELVDDVVPGLPADGTLRIVDFGCGKSYLTFALHHLLTARARPRGRARRARPEGGRDRDLLGARGAARLAGASLRARRDRRLRRRPARRPRRQPARVRHRHRRGARAGGALGGGRDPRRPVLPEGGVSADRERPAAAAPPPRPGEGARSPRSSRTRCARSCSSSPATGRSSWSSSIWSTRRRTS